MCTHKHAHKVTGSTLSLRFQEYAVNKSLFAFRHSWGHAEKLQRLEQTRTVAPRETMDNLEAVLNERENGTVVRFGVQM